MTEPAITPELVAKHNLTPEEYAHAREILGGREPSYTELGIFSVMWSEHCSYKNTRPLLKTFPTKSPKILVGAGEENAGIIDIGDGLAPYSHGSYAAAVLRPFVSEELCWIVSHHPLFQMHYYGAQTGEDVNARDAYREHPWFDATVEFCERYDENCFDPGYDWLPLEHFAPAVEDVFSRAPSFR